MKQVSVQFPLCKQCSWGLKLENVQKIDEWIFLSYWFKSLFGFCLEQTATPIKKFPDRVTFQTRKCITSLGFFAVEVGTALVSQVPPPHSWLRSWKIGQKSRYLIWLNSINKFINYVYVWKSNMRPWQTSCKHLQNVWQSSLFDFLN